MSFNANLNKKSSSRSIFRYSLDHFTKANTLSQSTPEEQQKKHTQIKIKVDRSAEGIKSIIEKYSFLKTSHENLNSLSATEFKNLLSKDEETNKLNEYLEELITNNEELKHLNQIEITKRNQIEAEQGSIAEYCNNLKKKFTNYNHTIDSYTNTIESLVTVNLNLQEDYEKKIDQCNYEIDRKRSSMEDRMKIVELQQDQIIEKDNFYLNILKEIEGEKTNFLERQMINKIRYQELERKYADLQKNIHELEVNDDIRKVESKGSNVRNTENNNQIGNIYLKINDCVNDNKTLENNIKDLSVQLNDKISRDSQKDLRKYMRSNKAKYS